MLVLIVQGILLAIRNRLRRNVPPPDEDSPLGEEGVFDEPDPEPISWNPPTPVG